MSRLKEQVLTMVTLQCNLPIKECAQNIHVHADAYMYYVYVYVYVYVYIYIYYIGEPSTRACTWVRSYAIRVRIHVQIHTPTRFTGTHVRWNMRETGGRCSARHWPPHQHGRTPFPHQHHRTIPTLPRLMKMPALFKGRFVLILTIEILLYLHWIIEKGNSADRSIIHYPFDREIIYQNIALIKKNF